MSTLDEIQAYLEGLESRAGMVQNAIDNGKSIEEIATNLGIDLNNRLIMTPDPLFKTAEEAQDAQDSEQLQEMQALTEAIGDFLVGN